MAAKLAKIRKLPAKSEKFTLSAVCTAPYNNDLFLCSGIEPFCFDIRPFSFDIGYFYSHSIVAGGLELMS